VGGGGGAKGEDGSGNDFVQQAHGDLSVKDFVD